MIEIEKKIIKFAAGTLLFFLPVIAVFASLMYLGVRSGELWNSDKVIDFEMQHPGETLFLRKILQDSDRYKFKKLIKLRPEIVILGSSRVMQFRREMFGNDILFYNAGGLAETPAEFQGVLELLPENYNPKIIFLGLDSFEFGKLRQEGGSLRLKMERPEYLTPTNWQPYMYVVQRLALDLAKNPKRINNYLWPKEPIYGKTAIGVLAMEGNGFRSDGSIQYGGYIVSHRADPKYIDAEDPSIIERARGGIAQFVFDSEFDEKKAEDLRNFLADAKARNIFIAGFAPPYSGEVLSELLNSPHHKKLFADFRSKMPEIFAEAGFPFYDFSDLSALGLDDRSMFDGFHPTETAAAAMLEQMFKSNQFKKAPLSDPKGMADYLKIRLDDPVTKPFEVNWQ